ncbi:hypothetical protein TGDOM2_293620 [Toxoplasma gondii GAB2-2007-GAL-DOM2]|uniref:Uncharacterized protein n=2 Tax=Toxoplasma gondii TaxID=5811 RepID=A0A086KRV8_TOXGO|nr:hypothetical protein TGDOM2_293620 [Toxoplasma gondii GAB2-2007-GAL-DOM2]KFG47126.1 hypothetical protein TGFOU_293620 [Toxoplasma gondii FOU]
MCSVVRQNGRPAKAGRIQLGDYRLQIQALTESVVCVYVLLPAGTSRASDSAPSHNTTLLEQAPERIRILQGSRGRTGHASPMSQLLFLERIAADWLRNDTRLLPTDETNATLYVPRQMLNTTRVPSNPASVPENAANDDSVPTSNSDDKNSEDAIPLPRIRKKNRPYTDESGQVHESSGQLDDPKSKGQDEEESIQETDNSSVTEDQLEQEPAQTVKAGLPNVYDFRMHTEGTQDATGLGEPPKGSTPDGGPSQQQLSSSAALVQGIMQGLRQFLGNREASVVPPEAFQDNSVRPGDPTGLQVTEGNQSLNIEQDRELVEKEGPPEEGISQGLRELELLRSARRRRNQKGATVVTRRCAGKASTPDADAVELDGCAFDDEAYEFLNKAQRMPVPSQVTPTDRSFRGRSRQQQNSATDGPPCVLWRQGCLLCGCFAGEVVCSPYCVLGDFAYGAKPAAAVGKSIHEEDSTAQPALETSGSSCCLMDRGEAERLPALFVSTPAILRSNPYGLWDDGIKPRKRKGKPTAAEETDSEQKVQDDKEIVSMSSSATASKPEIVTETAGEPKYTDREKNTQNRRGESQNGDHALGGGDRGTHGPGSRDDKSAGGGSHDGGNLDQFALPTLVDDAMRNSFSPIAEEVTRIAIAAATRAAMEAAAKAAVEAAIRLVSGGASEPPTEAIDRQNEKHRVTEDQQTPGNKRVQGDQEGRSSPESPVSSQGASAGPPISAAMISRYREQLMGDAGNTALGEQMAAMIAREIAQSNGLPMPTDGGQFPAGTTSGFLVQPPYAQQGASLISGRLSEEPRGPGSSSGQPQGRGNAPQSGGSNIGDVYGGPPPTCPSDCEIYFDGCTTCRCTDGGAMCRYRWCAQIVSAPTCLKSKNIRSESTERSLPGRVLTCTSRTASRALYLAISVFKQPTECW